MIVYTHIRGHCVLCVRVPLHVHVLAIEYYTGAGSTYTIIHVYNLEMAIYKDSI